MHDRYYDNSRLASAKRCLRKYYFRHAIDLDSSGFNKDLVFGSSWHAAMDVVWTLAASRGIQNLDTSEIVEQAYAAFYAKWLSEGGTPTEELGPDELQKLSPKHPMISMEMLFEYIEQRKKFFSDPSFELLEVERSFMVPLNPDKTLFYVGRMDKVFKKSGVINVGEHKTSSLYSKAAGFRSTFIDSFSPNSQVDGYLHAIHMLYGDKASSVWVDAALCHKDIHDVFKFIPVERQHAQLEAWLYDTRWWIETIEESWARLADIVEKGIEEPFMTAFPKNTEACMDYGRSCPYINLCKMVPNPLTLTETPEGFKKDVWSPFDRLELEKLGMEK